MYLPLPLRKLQLRQLLKLALEITDDARGSAEGDGRHSCAYNVPDVLRLLCVSRGLVADARPFKEAVLACQRPVTYGVGFTLQLADVVTREQTSAGARAWQRVQRERLERALIS